MAKVWYKTCTHFVTKLNIVVKIYNIFCKEHPQYFTQFVIFPLPVKFKAMVMYLITKACILKKTHTHMW